MARKVLRADWAGAWVGEALRASVCVFEDWASGVGPWYAVLQRW